MRRASLVQLESEMDQLALAESEKDVLRAALIRAENEAQKQMRRRLTTDDFEPLAVIGRGAFGEVRLVRMRDGDNYEIFGESPPPTSFP